MLLNVLFGGGVLDCAWRPGLAQGGVCLCATNSAQLLGRVLGRLGLDDEAMVERGIAQLEETPVLPVSPCSAPL